MKADFLDAHYRHWTDAELLFQAVRWANADHLYGIAAECGLKRLMEAFDIDSHWVGGIPDLPKDKAHVMEAKKTSAWDRYESYRSGHQQGVGYALPKNPFQNWDISDRYAAQNHFNKAQVSAHRTGALLVHELIKKADQEGVL